MTTDDDMPDAFEDPPGGLGDTIGIVMGEEIVSAPPTITWRQAATRMNDDDIGLLVIGDPDRVQGVVSERDIVRAVANGVDLDATPVGESLSTKLKWAKQESTVGDVIEEMMEGYLRHVLVGDDDGRLVGIVSMRDLLAAYPAPE